VKPVDDAFDWVSARAACSLLSVFQILGERVRTDVDIANRAPGSKRRFRVAIDPLKIVVARTHPAEEAANIVFELCATDVAVRKGASAQLFRARPALNEDGECLLEVDGQTLRLWQVSRKALEDLMFGD